MSSRLAQRSRAAARKTAMISGGEVIGVPPANGGAGSYSICNCILRALSTGPLQYLPHCVLASIVFTIAVEMVDLKGLSDIRRKSPSEFLVALFAAAAVPAIGA